MFSSAARINANRRNAARSTGPKTVEGKRRSRANALKHGLCASVVVEEDLNLVQERSLQWFNALKPQNRAQAWLVDRVAVISIRIDRSERMERRARDKKALKAELCWEDDRAREAKRLGAMLEGQPEQVVEELRRTPQGCEWLMGRWAMLARSADVSKSWTPDQVRLAFDLLGTPQQFREGHKPGDELDFEGRLVQSGDDPAAVARRQVAELMERVKVAEDLDEVRQALAVSDLDDEDDAELKRIRRYETALHRRLRWYLDQIKDESPGRKTLDYLRPEWTSNPTLEVEAMPEPKVEAAPELYPSSSPHPPFDLEPDEAPEPGQQADIPAILKSRREKKLAKAESRRDARRRKLEKLRA